MLGANPAARIAIVEDDPVVRETVADLVRTEGYSAVALGDAAALLAMLDGPYPPDLIVLDLKLPDRDGLGLAGTIRATSDVPIIMLTGRGGDIDRILGLEIGADDYVVKPFNARELLARIKAVLRRRGRETAPPPAATRHGYRFDGHVLDLDGRRLIAPSGDAVPLTVAEFDLLTAMVRSSGRVLSRDQLLDLTHRAGGDVFDRTVDVLVLRLRRKIEPTPGSPRYIRTERGVGYVFDADVKPIGSG
ncbi:response regulator [Chthonobacter albigriseus]|uniref:response regulator n=1 Tax=Chthonobacter albigriseus TaxID=1683161 RepID=UPI0015EF37A4